MIFKKETIMEAIKKGELAAGSFEHLNGCETCAVGAVFKGVRRNSDEYFYNGVTKGSYCLSHIAEILDISYVEIEEQEISIETIEKALMEYMAETDNYWGGLSMWFEACSHYLKDAKRATLAFVDSYFPEELEVKI